MKILFIACYSPLINNSASIETLQYLNNLSKIYGNEVHLLTVNFPKNSIYYDEYILSMLDKNVKMHIISGGKIFEKIMPKKSSKIEIKDSIKNNKNFVKNLLKKGERNYSWVINSGTIPNDVALRMVYATEQEYTIENFELSVVTQD